MSDTLEVFTKSCMAEEIGSTAFVVRDKVSFMVILYIEWLVTSDMRKENLQIILTGTKEENRPMYWKLRAIVKEN